MLLRQWISATPLLVRQGKNERFQRLDSGVANIAYAKDRIWEKELK